MNLDCRHAAGLMSQGLDKQLSIPEKIALRLHLLICQACRRYRRQLNVLQRIFHHLAQTDSYDKIALSIFSAERLKAFRQRLLKNL